MTRPYGARAGRAAAFPLYLDVTGLGGGDGLGGVGAGLGVCSSGTTPDGLGGPAGTVVVGAGEGEVAPARGVLADGTATGPPS